MGSGNWQGCSRRPGCRKPASRRAVRRCPGTACSSSSAPPVSQCRKRIRQLPSTGCSKSPCSLSGSRPIPPMPAPCSLSIRLSPTAPLCVKPWSRCSPMAGPRCWNPPLCRFAADSGRRLSPSRSLLTLPNPIQHSQQAKPPPHRHRQPPRRRVSLSLRSATSPSCFGIWAPRWKSKPPSA